MGISEAAPGTFPEFISSPGSALAPLLSCGSELLEMLQRREPKGSPLTGLLPKAGQEGTR